MAATEIQQGIARVFGMDGAVFTVGLAVAVENTMETGDLDQEFQTDELKGQNGEVETIIASDESHSLTIQLAPKSTTRALAIAEMQKIRDLGAIARVQTAGFSIATYNGNWNCLGWSGKLARDGVFVMTLKLKAWIVNRASLTAEPVISG